MALITKRKRMMDSVGHYARPELLSLNINSSPAQPMHGAPAAMSLPAFSATDTPRSPDHATNSYPNAIRGDSPADDRAAIARLATG
jgi:aliphatic nitrilase